MVKIRRGRTVFSMILPLTGIEIAFSGAAEEASFLNRDIDTSFGHKCSVLEVIQRQGQTDNS